MLATKTNLWPVLSKLFVYMLDSIPDLPVVHDEDTEKEQEEKEETAKTLCL